MHTVRFWFDFISPYSWLALEAAGAFADEHDVRWDLRPISYGALLGKTGLLGPVEVPVKRAYTFDDVARAARLAGLELVGPPAHPFRSLEALRTMWLFREAPEALVLARGLAAATWRMGRDLTRVEVLESVVTEVGLDAAELKERIAAPEAKRGLVEETEAAFEAGVFGVPTFGFEGELFWGHDRLGHLAARLGGLLPPSRPASAPLLERPVGIERRR